MKKRVFIVDDHYMVIEGIRSLLQDEPDIEWTGHAMNAASCLAFLKQQLPDIILMDYNLPDMSGVELCKEVREKYPSVFILGLSTFNQHGFIKRMIENGASGYLLKNATQQEIMNGIEAAMKGKTYFSDEAARTMRKPGQEDIPLLTRREKEVLGLIAEGMTNNEIASALFISVTTVDTHRKNLLSKFASKNIAALVSSAVRMGII